MTRRRALLVAGGLVDDVDAFAAHGLDESALDEKRKALGKLGNALS